MARKIAYVTDIHLDEKYSSEQEVDARNNWNVILKDIASRQIGQIIYGGDIGETSSHKWFFESLSKFEISIILGNHDTYSEVHKYFDKSVDPSYSELFYSFEDNYHKFVFLDSSSGEIGENQLSWLKRTLNTEKNIVIFIHHPILPINAEVDKQFALKGRHKIELELNKIKNNVTVFSGHYHFDDIKTKKNIRQFVTPAGSFQIVKEADEIKVHKNFFGYRIIDFDKTIIKSKVILF